MHDHVRSFLEMVLPWTDAGGAYFNIHWKSARVGHNGKPFWDGRASTDLPGLLTALHRASLRADVRDLYICMSSQQLADARTSKRGGQYLKAQRAQEHVVALRGLYIDIDVKEGAYATRKDAVLGLKAFLAATGMPTPSAMVLSGTGGMHVHWSFETPLTRQEWQPLANKLAAATRAHGLICDPQCTIDSARILRIPGTLNYKTTPPAKVELFTLGEFCDRATVEKALAGYPEGPAPRAAARSGVFEFAPVMGGATPEGNELSAGIEGPPAPSIDEVAKHCGFVATALAEGGASYNNPLWYLTTSIAAFCEDGRNAAHRMANKHAAYSVQDTDAMFDRARQSHAARDIGWPQCEKIALHGTASCAVCPHLALKKSPLNFGYPQAPRAPQASAPITHAVNGKAAGAVMPDGYFQTADGLVLQRKEDDNGNVISLPVAPYPMTNAWLQDNPWVLHFSTSTGSGRVTKVEVPLEQLATKDGVSKVLGRQGILLKEKGNSILKEFLVSWIQKLQQQRDSVVSSSPFGWSIVNGKLEGFTYAGKVWGNGSERPAVSPDPILSYQYTPKGNLAAWVEAAQIITKQRRPALDAILAAAFGAPLVRFTGQPGVLLSCYSPESGIGKTTAMRIAQAVWGDPVKALQGVDDTPYSVLRKIGELKALPLFWDELKGEKETNKFVVMAFQLTQGKERSRLNADVTQRDPGTWQTLLMSASNDSLLDPIARATKSTTAGIYRVFEYQVAPSPAPSTNSHATVSRTIAALNDNYGHAGLLYAQFLGANHARVAKEVAALQDSLCGKFDASNDERFWFVAMTTVLCGAIYANELGLTEIDLHGLKDFLVTVLGNMRGEVKDAPTDMRNTMSVSNILAQFLNAMRTRHTLRTNRIHVGQGKPAKGAIQIRNDASKLDGIYVHIGQEDGMMRISSTYLSRWMADHDYSRHAFSKALKDEFGARVVNGKLGSGTDYVGAMEYLLELDLNDPRLRSFIE